MIAIYISCLGVPLLCAPIIWVVCFVDEVGGSWASSSVWIWQATPGSRDHVVTCYFKFSRLQTIAEEFCSCIFAELCTQYCPFFTSLKCPALMVKYRWCLWLWCHRDRTKGNVSSGSFVIKSKQEAAGVEEKWPSCPISPVTDGCVHY